jgi:hypothetical protein
MKNVIELGDTVKDKVSGLQGIAVSKTEYLNGRVLFIVQPERLIPFRDPEEYSVDEPQLKIVKKAMKNLKKISA